MPRLVLAVTFVALFAASCVPISPFSAQPHSQFHLAPNAPKLAPILPEGVAALDETPPCDFRVLGQAWVTHRSIDITSSRITALKQQAAQYGADAIILHPNRAYCSDGREIAECKGRGEYVIATAIQYLNKAKKPFSQPALETTPEVRYDNPNQNQPQTLILPEYPL